LGRISTLLVSSTIGVHVLTWLVVLLLKHNFSSSGPVPPLHAEKHDSYIQKYIATGFKKMIDKQREVESMRKDGSTFPSTLGLAEVFHNGTRLFVGFIKDVSVQKALLVANAEREASDELLYNILPVHIADRLKEDPSHIADQYDNTTILFADIVDFTNRTSKMTPHDGK
jgi:PAS domain S-box-containing protein